MIYQKEKHDKRKTKNQDEFENNIQQLYHNKLLENLFYINLPNILVYILRTNNFIQDVGKALGTEDTSY